MYRLAAVSSLIAVALLVLRPDVASAQPAATAFGQLQGLLQPGQTVSVTGLNGSLSKGVVFEVVESSVRLSIAGLMRDFSERDVFEVRQRRRDSVANGAKIGAAVGAGLGLWRAFSHMAHNDEGFGSGTASTVLIIAGIAGLYAGVGAGAGVGIDAMIQKTHLIYQAKPGSSSAVFSVAPILSSARQGMMLSVRF